MFVVVHCFRYLKQSSINTWTKSKKSSMELLSVDHRPYYLCLTEKIKPKTNTKKRRTSFGRHQQSLAGISKLSSDVKYKLTSVAGRLRSFETATSHNFSRFSFKCEHTSHWLLNRGRGPSPWWRRTATTTCLMRARWYAFQSDRYEINSICECLDHRVLSAR